MLNIILVLSILLLIWSVTVKVTSFDRAVWAFADAVKNKKVYPDFVEDTFLVQAEMISNEFINVLKEIMGISVMIISFTELPKNTLGMQRENIIYINQEIAFRAFKGNINAFEELVSTVLHEARHVWQKEHGWDFSDYISSSVNYDAYYNQACEIDARAFEEYLEEFKERFAEAIQRATINLKEY